MHSTRIPKKILRMWWTEEYATIAVSRYGLCTKHGVYGMCTIPGCTTNKQHPVFVCKHGAYGMMCTIPGCTTNKQHPVSVCKHGAGCRLRADIQGAPPNAHARGLFTKHGGKGVCTVSGYVTNTVVRGLCAKHGGDAMCTVRRTTTGHGRGVFCKHRGSLQTVCVQPGCTTNANARSLCKRIARALRMMKHVWICQQSVVH
jgi:hypothetical protein